MDTNIDQKIIFNAFIKYQAYAGEMKPITVKKRNAFRDELFRTIDKCLIALSSNKYTFVEKNKAYNRGRLLYQQYCGLKKKYPELVTNSLDNKIDRLLEQMSIQASLYVERFRKNEVGGVRINIESVFDEKENIKKLINQPMEAILKSALADHRFSIVSKVDQTVYITQAGQKYHRANCPFCRRFKLIETTHSKIANAGYDPCRCIGTTDKVNMKKIDNTEDASSNKRVISVFIDESVRTSYWATLDPTLSDKQASYSYIICEGYLESENEITEENTLYQNACLANEAEDTTFSAIEAVSAVLLKIAFNYDFHGDVVIYTDNTGAVNNWYKANQNRFLADQFESVKLTYISRELNKKADAVGRQACFTNVPTELIDLIKDRFEKYSKMEEELNFVKQYFPEPRYNIPNLIEELRLLAEERGEN